MWHASISILHRNRRVDSPQVRKIARELAHIALAGVGSPAGYWWMWSPNGVGHMRVPTTTVEVERWLQLVPTSEHDAGPEGTWRNGRP